MTEEDIICDANYINSRVSDSKTDLVIEMHCQAQEILEKLKKNQRLTFREKNMFDSILKNKLID